MYSRENELSSAEELWEFLQNNPEVCEEQEDVYNKVDIIIKKNG